ncbi:glutamate-5-semialdehyde dehydrogenase [Bacillus sp. AFS040349]|nr:glutamate-5-semialdehyde dehydrogenase [Bacillus sp. AFS040349]
MMSVREQAKRAQKAGKIMSMLSTNQKNQALSKMAETLEANIPSILKANEKDLTRSKEKKLDAALLDRLFLTENRVIDFCRGLRQVADLDDPTNKTLMEWELENGVKVKKIAVPFGVIGMIYEARPNVTVDATGLALKSGNAIVLKGGSSALMTNKAIIDLIYTALDETDVPKDAVQFVNTSSRDAAQQLFTMREYIDLLIPRGGEELIQAVINQATIPVLETGVGNCHLYIDQEADVEMALSVLVNAKTDRPAVCNAVETVLIHDKWFNKYHDVFFTKLEEYGISIHGDEKVLKRTINAVKANEEDWANEYLSLKLAVKVVDSVEDAIEHIDRYGSKHSEAIITENAKTAKTFLALVDAAAVYHNASTRFTDGGALGFGCEIGISTQKLHARGPMGLPSLTTTKYLMYGSGQIRE